jgi:hypothetical protein
MTFTMTDPTLNRIPRDGTADLLKGFAVLFMIQVHIMEQFAAPDTFNSRIGIISTLLGGPPCAPVFMAVMGYFLASSQKPLASFLKRGTLLFAGGIALNTARSANLLVRIYNGEVIMDPWNFILGADILTLAGLSLIITGILRLAFKNRASLYFFAALAVAAISPVLNRAGSLEIIPSHGSAFLWGTEEWSYFPLFPWYSYVLAGYAFCLFIRSPLPGKADLKHQFIYFIPLWTGILITLPFAARIAHNLPGAGGYYHHGILFFGWTLLFMVSYLVAMKLIELHYGDHFVARSVKWIGKQVTILYVIQWLIIGNIATVLYRSEDLFQVSAWVGIVTLATILGGLLFVKIRQRVKRNV